jgi:hypothetical protein
MQSRKCKISKGPLGGTHQSVCENICLRSRLSVAFKTAEGWSRDVTLDIADEVCRRYTRSCVSRGRSIPLGHVRVLKFKRD